MKSCLKILALVLFPVIVNAQSSPDSLRQALKTAATDSAKWSILYNLGRYYYDDKADSALKYADQALLIARANDRKINESSSLWIRGGALAFLGKYAESFEAYQDALKIAEDPNYENSAWKNNIVSFHKNRLQTLVLIHLQMGFRPYYPDSTDLRMFHFRKALQLSEEIKDTALRGLASWGLAGPYRSSGKLDSALTLLNVAEQIFQRYDIKKYLAYVYMNKSGIYADKKDKNNQLYYIHKALEVVSGQNNRYASYWAYSNLTRYYLQEKQKDSSLYYAKKNVELIVPGLPIGYIYLLLSHSYELQHETDSAYKYQGLALKAIDSLNTAKAKSLSDFQKKSFKDQMRVRDLEQESASFQNKIRTNALLGGLFTLLVIAFFLFRNNRQKQKANKQIAKQKEKVESTLTQLQSTQAQLIQSEKMASLGELTAGIAHEIQNPLNFVNNFSEVSTELIQEIKEERGKNKEERNEALVDEILDDINQNLVKINHHGKRADTIVKGMLQHSQSSSGVKEFTDINALADEYLRLAYHGLKAKDKTFNTTINTDFDETIGRINIMPQDIGRVLLNLINNACYAVSEKEKTSVEGYEPIVSVRTKKVKGELELSVTDNGNGIPAKVLDKVFQPFFTTKPTGQGTGLGLSLSYDIVKAHGGEITVNSKDGAGSEFIIKLPIS